MAGADNVEVAVSVSRYRKRDWLALIPIVADGFLLGGVSNLGHDRAPSERLRAGAVSAQRSSLLSCCRCTLSCYLMIGRTLLPDVSAQLRSSAFHAAGYRHAFYLA